MPSESAKLFRLIQFEYKAPGGGTVLFYTDLPGDALALRVSITLPAAADRRTYHFAFPNGTKGRIIKVRIIPANAGAMELYHARLYARRTGLNASDWTWADLNVAPNREWVPVKVPVPPTPEEVRSVAIPVPPTPNGFQPLKLPVEPSPAEQIWHELPMDR